MEKVELNNNIEICLVNLGNTCKYEYYTVRNTDDLKKHIKILDTDLMLMKLKYKV